MKKIYIFLIAVVTINTTIAQDNVLPVKEHTGTSYITNATVHTGNGQVLQNTTIQFTNGKITQIGPAISVPQGAIAFNAAGKHVYPGLILSTSNLGLKEIGAQVKGSNDFREIGDLNPGVQSIVAYNTDSKIINTLRSNGILLANIIPQGSLITGTSSVVQLDAWNFDDAVYKMNGGIHMNMPSLLNRPGRQVNPLQTDPLKQSMDRIEMVKSFFMQAKAYNQSTDKQNTNIKFEAVKGLFNKSQRLYIHCNYVKEMLVAIDYVKEFNFDVTIVGGQESFLIADLLKQNNISVILLDMHDLPQFEDDNIDQLFTTPATLQKAGVLYAISDEDGHNYGRNLMFSAGTASSYGLTKEQALQAITLNPAKILGISDRAGSIEVGKDANIIISEGDIFDMKSSIIVKAFIQGRDIDLNNKHTELNRKYKTKYGIQ